MAVKLNGGTLYPMNNYGYDLSPDEQDLIAAALEGRSAQFTNTPEQSIAGGFAAQDLMKRAMYEQSIAEQQYRQRQEDERQRQLKQQEIDMNEAAAQQQYTNREVPAMKAKILGTDMGQLLSNPYYQPEGDIVKSLTNSLDEILGAGQPKSTGSTYTNTIKNKQGQVYQPGIGFGAAPKKGSSVSDRAKQNQSKMQQKPAPPKAEAPKSSGNAFGEKPENLFSIIWRAFQEGNEEQAKQKLAELEELHQRQLMAKR